MRCGGVWGAGVRGSGCLCRFGCPLLRCPVFYPLLARRVLPPSRRSSCGVCLRHLSAFSSFWGCVLRRPSLAFSSAQRAYRKPFARTAKGGGGRCGATWVDLIQNCSGCERHRPHFAEIGPDVVPHFGPKSRCEQAAFEADVDPQRCPGDSGPPDSALSRRVDCT